MITALLLQAAQADEAAYYAVDYLVPPEGERVEVGGLDFLPDGRLICSTRRGQVWIVDNPLAKDPKDAKFHLFCEGLHEGLGLEVVEGDVYVLQRGELSRLVDEDKDGTCDRIDTVAQGWGYSGFYHEFAFGLPRDNEGNFYISLNVSFGDPQWWHGRSTVPDRGWILRLKRDGSIDRVACGARSPCGLGRNSAGDIFYTDNQGDWMPACPIFQVTDGAFFGHPASLNWTAPYLEAHRTASDTIPPEHERVNAAIWLPYDWSRSTGNLIEDTTAGKFGPFAGQMFVAEMTNGYVLRAELQKVRGQYQGWCIPFRHKVGSNVRLRFASDGTLFCGFTDRGWGGQPPGDGIGRIRWTGKQPFDIKSVKLINKGFVIELTKPVALVASATAFIKNTVEQYDYDYWWEYGSPRRHVTQSQLVGSALDDTHTRVVLEVADLKPGMVARVKLGPIVTDDGEFLLHDEFAYTINQLPEGPECHELVAKLVPAPEAKQSGNEGVVYLMRGDPLDAWKLWGPDGTWRVEEVRLDADSPQKLVVDKDAKPDDWSGHTIHGHVEGGSHASIESKVALGDADLSMQFMLSAGADGRLLVDGNHDILLADGSRDTAPTLSTCGAIPAIKWSTGTPWPGSPPVFNAYRGAGKWHTLSVKYEAPHEGKKAKFQRVMIDDVLLQEDVEVPAPSDSADSGEPWGTGRILIAIYSGDIAVRGLRVLNRTPRAEESGWTPIFDGKSLDGWKISDDGKWKVEDGEIVGSGPVSHLFSPRGDYKNFEVRAKCKISDGGNSGMYFRVAYGPGWPDGYEAQINSTHTDPVRTGSIYNLAPIKSQLVPPDTWFKYDVTCRDEPLGTHITIRVNDIVVNDYLDKDRKHASGHIAFQQHNDGSFVRIKDVEIRELP